MERKASRPVILDISTLSNFCDYFIICSADSSRQVRAIYEEVLERCKEHNIEIRHSEDDVSDRWILVDFFDVILHIFLEEAREFYNIEYLWKAAKRIRAPKGIHTKQREL